MPPVDSTWRWPFCVSFHGAYANAAPAATPPIHPAPSSRRAGTYPGRPGHRRRGRAGCRRREQRAGWPERGVRRARTRRARPRMRACRRGPERVGLPQIEGRLEERMADPGDLPRLQERIAEVLPDVAAEMEDQRPAHDDREGNAPDRGENRLPRGQLARHDDGCVGLATRRRSCRAPRAPRATAPKSVVGTYHAACTRIVNASACSWPTSRSPSEATPSHS